MPSTTTRAATAAFAAMASGAGPGLNQAAVVPSPLMLPSNSSAELTNAAVDAFAHLAAAAEELHHDPSGAGEEAFTARLLRGWRTEIDMRHQHQNVLLAKKQQLKTKRQQKTGRREPG